MPVVNKPTSMALVPQEESSSASTQPEGQADVVRPRQPSSLQGLLRFAMEATRAEDAPHNSEFLPMDEERRQFLEKALGSMTIDVVEIMQKQIKIIKKVEKATSENEVQEVCEAIDIILEYIDNIDIANDFHKIGGFLTLYPCLKCQHPKIRAGGCELLAVLSQNNPYCQQIILDNEFIPMLITMIDKDDDKNVVVKALYALGSIVRESIEGFNQLKHYNGLTVLLNTIQKSTEDRIITKTSFLLSALCRSYPDIKSQLLSLDYLPCLISIVSKERTESHEHVLSLLVSLVEDNPAAIAECQSSKYNLKEIIHRYINLVRNKEEYQEEETYCKRLLHLLNST